jgi:hypothetical protein
VVEHHKAQYGGFYRSARTVKMHVIWNGAMLGGWDQELEGLVGGGVPLT